MKSSAVILSASLIVCWPLICTIFWLIWMYSILSKYKYRTSFVRKSKDSIKWGFLSLWSVSKSEQVQESCWSSQFANWPRWQQGVCVLSLSNRLTCGMIALAWHERLLVWRLKLNDSWEMVKVGCGSNGRRFEPGRGATWSVRREKEDGILGRLEPMVGDDHVRSRGDQEEPRDLGLGVGGHPLRFVLKTCPGKREREDAETAPLL